MPLAAIPIEQISTHVHLSLAAQEALFGSGASLSVLRPRKFLHGQCVYTEEVRIVGASGTLPHASVLGPVWEQTVVELTEGDARLLGLEAVRGMPDNLSGTPGCTLQGPRGVVLLSSGAVVVQAHIHLSPVEANEAGVRQGDRVVVCLAQDPRALIADVVVRVHPTYTAVLHVPPNDLSPLWTRPGAVAQIVRQGE